MRRRISDRSRQPDLADGGVGGRATTAPKCRPSSCKFKTTFPLGKGMGSSAAALTAGVVIADQLLDLGWKPLRILDEAARLEGHPDNVAPCTLGSIVASAIDSGGVTRAVRLDLPRRFGLAVVVPDFDLPTAQGARGAARRLQPRRRRLQRAARLAADCGAWRPAPSDAFPAALEDRFHQPYREALVPGLHEILKLRAPGLLGCALSGAGPSILVFFERGYESVCDLVRQIFRLHGHESETLFTGIAEHGFEVTEEAEPGSMSG